MQNRFHRVGPKPGEAQAPPDSDSLVAQKVSVNAPFTL